MQTEVTCLRVNAKHSPALISANDLLSPGSSTFMAPSRWRAHQLYDTSASGPVRAHDPRASKTCRWGRHASRDRRSNAAGFAGHSAAATLELFQEYGETFWDRLFDGIVFGPEPLPDCLQPWPSGQDVTRFGVARRMLPALATSDSYRSRCTLPRARRLNTMCPLLLRTSVEF